MIEDFFRNAWRWKCGLDGDSTPNFWLLDKTATFNISKKGRDISVKMKIDGIISKNGTTRVEGNHPTEPNHRINQLLTDVKIIG